MAPWKWVVIGLAVSLAAARVEAGFGFPEHLVQYRQVPTEGAYPTDIIGAPNGDIWFTEQSGSRIGRLAAADGMIHEFVLPSLGSPLSIAPGPDGNYWFTDFQESQIGRVTPSGTITLFPLPSAERNPIDITAGPDGNMWYTARTFSRGISPGAVGRVTPEGTISDFLAENGAYFITRGADDALWFTAASSIVRMTTTNQRQTFPLDVYPEDIITGPDGALWFTIAGGNVAGGGLVEYAIGRLTTSGEFTGFPSPALGMSPSQIARGPDDNIWFTTFNAGIWRLNAAGTMQQIVELAEEDYAAGITAGADGYMWFAAPQRNEIGSVETLVFDAFNIVNSAPLGLARGADDSIWYADAGIGSGGRIGRIHPDGSLVQYDLGGDRTPAAVAIGRDGTAWFANYGTNTIGHLTADGELVEHPLPSPSNPQDIVLGPDGNFWFTEYEAGAIGRITPQGVIRRFPVEDDALGAAGHPRIAADVSRPYQIAVGPDGNLWFTDPGLNMIGRITTSGEIVQFPIPTAGSGPAGIAAGWDGNLYFTQEYAGRVARITTAGVVTELGTPDLDSYPYYITLGPDGAMWFTEPDVNRLGRIARDGRITKFYLPDVDSYPTGIIGRGDGRLFVGLINRGQIAYTDLAAAEPTRTATSTRTQTPTRTPTVTRTVPPGSTVTSTPTITLTPTLTRTVPPGSTQTATPTETPTRLRTDDCFGDCDGDGSVVISELITSVNIALGNAQFVACANADADGDEAVRINDLIAAVGKALQGCSL